MSTAAPLQVTAAKSQLVSKSSHAGLLLQRKCACGGSPRASGMCEECQDKRLQHKLTIGASNDPLKVEADRVAEQVLAAPAHSAVSSSPPRIQRLTGQSSGDAGTAPASVDRVLSSSGRPLEPALRQDMEQHFSHDFSQVQVHSGAAAEQSARDVNANAYTVGHNVVFGAGRFAHGTHDGRRSIAHELTHVVQQGIATAAIRSGKPITTLRLQHSGSIARQKLGPDEPPSPIERSFDYQPRLIPIQGHAVREVDQPDDGAFFNGINMIIRRRGEKLFQTREVSGNPGSSEAEVNIGPIPNGRYRISPQITRATVTKLQRGICGANGIQSGYQELTSTDSSPCSTPNHYCTVSCPTSNIPNQVCFTPVGCWGAK